MREPATKLEKQKQKIEEDVVENWQQLKKTRVFNNRKLEGAQGAANIFASTWGRLTSSDIVQTMSDMGLGAEWFSGQFEKLWNDESTSNHAKIRLLTMLTKVMSQAEGTTVTVNNVADREAREIDAEVLILEKKLLEATPQPVLENPETAALENTGE